MAPRSATSSAAPLRVVVLGSTGSVGVNALAVIDHLTRTGSKRFDVVGLAAGTNARRLIQQRQQLGLAGQHPALALAHPESDGTTTRQIRQSGATTFSGPDAAIQLVEHCRPDVVVAAIVGIAGLPATLAAVEQGCTIALANKETLVAAGAFVMQRVQQCGATLLPVDSEHSAIFQCLGRESVVGSQKSGPAAQDAGASDPDYRLPATDPRIARLTLTASGGPFRDTPVETMRRATPEQALNHPTWDMGPKISIDSATMMNKALELIEAHHLFGVPADRLEVVIHPQSIVHSFVEFADHSVLAQLGPPDMRTPIQVALSWPDRLPGAGDRLDWQKLRRLDFFPPDPERFPALRLAYRVMNDAAGTGTTAGAIVNAANEAAIAAFLEHRIRFGRIVELVEAALDALPAGPIKALADVMEADRAARGFVARLLEAETVAAADIKA